MGRIQSSIGLFSGVPILDTVDQLIALAARPRDLIINRTQGLQSEQIAITQLTSLVLAVKLSSDALGETDVFQSKTITSQDATLLSAKLLTDGNPPAGNYSFTPVRRAQTHQVLSSTFNSLTDPVGAGSFSFQKGGFLDAGLALTELNGGAGVARGEIRITDRTGTAAVIDLRFAQTVQDVLDAINSESTTDITATAEGDQLRLTDTTSGAGGITVVEIGGGTTAAGLGLSGIDGVDTSASVIGTDVLSLHSNLKLTNIRDGGGVGFRSEVNDLVINLIDSTTLNIDFNAAKQAAATTSATEGVNAQLTFTAVSTGAGSDGVTIRFIDNATITKGNETVVYDASDTSAKTLTFSIDLGQTDAADIVAALAGDATAAAQFTAVAGGTGAGLVDLLDTAVTSGGAPIDPQNVTLSDVLAVLNQADPAKLSAAISSDGDHIELTDLTAGGGTFSVASAVGSTVAEDLGLTGTAVAGVITSEQLLAGLNTSLLSSLSGGSGLGILGVIGLTDRSGATDTVDLVSAETIDDVVALINAATVGITASVNDARNGIVLNDTTGSTTSNLIVANNDVTNSADAFGITVNAAQTSIDGGSLNRFTVSRQTLLSDLNGGKGVDLKSFVITDASGAVGAIVLNTSGAEPETVGEVIDAINAASINVSARINDNGDGILLTETVGGTGTLSVREVGSGTTAADLNLFGSATTQLISGTPTQVIDGTTRTTIAITAADGLSDVVSKINAANAGVTASALFDGSTYRLSITSDQTGSANQLLLDTSGVSFSFQEIAAAQDALLLFGSIGNASIGALVSSTTNDFPGIIPGAEITVEGPSTSPVTVTVSEDSSSLIEKVESFISAFNSLRTQLDSLTDFNELDNSTGILFGSRETLRIETDLTNLVTGRFFGVGKFESLGAVGIEIDDKGQLSLDKDRLQEAFDNDATELKTFFTDDTLGISTKFATLIDQLAGEDSSLLTNRSDALTRKIDTNNDRIEFFNVRLETQRNLLLDQFFQMEFAIGKLQSSLNALSAIQPIAPLVSTRQ